MLSTSRLPSAVTAVATTTLACTMRPPSAPQLAPDVPRFRSPAPVAFMRARAGGPASSVVPVGPPPALGPHGPLSRCRPCTSPEFARAPVSLTARFNACRGERCSLPRLGVIRAAVPDERSVPAFLLLELALPAMRTADGEKATRGWSTGSPAQVQNRSKRSSAGPEEVQTDARGARDRSRRRPGGAVRNGQVWSGVHAVWTNSGPELPSDHCDLCFLDHRR